MLDPVCTWSSQEVRIFCSRGRTGSELILQLSHRDTGVSLRVVISLRCDCSPAPLVFYRWMIKNKVKELLIIYSQYLICCRLDVCFVLRVFSFGRYLILLLLGGFFVPGTIYSGLYRKGGRSTWEGLCCFFPEQREPSSLCSLFACMTVDK